jgi:hypothetical protein
LHPNSFFHLRRGKKEHKGVRNATKAMRVLCQTSMNKNKEVRVVNVKQFSEEQILLAFQDKCADLGKIVVDIVMVSPFWNKWWLKGNIL